MEKEWEETKGSADTNVANRGWYTQREWDRTVGIDKVPPEYATLQKSNTTDDSKETP
jgi:hypothetical protein